MALPETVLDFLTNRAKTNGMEWDSLNADENLLKCGALDSFAVMEMVALLEEAAGKRVPPADLQVTTFDSKGKIEAYWEGFKE